MSRPARTVTRQDGAPVALGKLLGRGGEGEVYEVLNEPGLVCKLYLSPLPPARARKLAAMTALATPELLAIAAWPTATVHGGPPATHAPLGFLMPRLSDRLELHKLTHPADRLRAFPEVGYDFLICVATNLARAFSTLHARGLVVGDVNESGIMVARDGTVMFIDCDSMQLTIGAETFTCDVGKPEFQPPEILLHHATFRGITRTPDHDAFGLAVALFQLLFFGWHPYSVRMLDGDQQPTADNIKHGRYPFARDFWVTDFTRPPHALPPDALPDHVRALFDRAFAAPPQPPSAPAPRPTASEWVMALERLAMESETCSRYMTHVHPRHLTRCPFCALDLKLGFPILPHVALDDARLKAIWSEVQAAYFALSSPTPAPDLPLPDPPPLTPPLATFARRTRLITRLQLAALPLFALALLAPWLIAVAPALIAALEAWRLASRPPDLTALARRVKDHRRRFAEAERALAAPRDPAPALNHADARQAFELITHHDDKRSAALFRLHERLVEDQTRAWLASHTLRRAGLAAIPGRVVVLLEKRSLATAADVATLRKRRPRGVDPDHVKALTRWEFSLLNRFVPDLDTPTYREAIDALHHRLDDEHAHAMQRLVLARDWLAERLIADRRRRAADLATYRERFTPYAEDLVLLRAATRRLPPPVSGTHT